MRRRAPPLSEIRIWNENMQYKQHSREVNGHDRYDEHRESGGDQGVRQ